MKICLTIFTLEAKMSIISSAGATEMKQDDAVTLHCNSNCTFDQLEVIWLKDGRALSVSGSTLQLGSLTAEDSGRYTCALKTDRKTTSLPYRLHVQAAEEGLFLQFSVSSLFNKFMLNIRKCKILETAADKTISFYF